MQVYA